MLMKEIETERLLLRQFRNSDFRDFTAMLADPEVMKYIGQGVPVPREDAWKWMATYVGHWQLRGYGLWAVEEKATQTFIGRIGLFYPEGWPGLEVGWMLVRTSWGRGYALEGAKAAMNIAFNHLKAEKIISLIHPKNEKSIKLAEKLGERFRKLTVINGIEALEYERFNSAERP